MDWSKLTPGMFRASTRQGRSMRTDDGAKQGKWKRGGNKLTQEEWDAIREARKERREARKAKRLASAPIPADNQYSKQIEDLRRRQAEGEAALKAKQANRAKPAHDPGWERNKHRRWQRYRG